MLAKKLEAFSVIQKAFEQGIVDSNVYFASREEVDEIFKSFDLGSRINTVSDHVFNSLDIANSIVDLTNVRHYVDALIYNSEGELAIIQRSNNDDFQPGKWALPGGKVEQGEKLKNALKREVEEEIGISVEIANYCCTYKNSDNSYSHYFYCYYETEKEEASYVLDSEEIQQIAFCKPDCLGDYDFLLDLGSRLNEILSIEYSGKFLTDQEVEQLSINKAFEIMEKAFENGNLSSEDYFKAVDIYKARSGVYENTLENRKLGRVGKPYGGKKEKVVENIEKKFEQYLELNYNQAKGIYIKENGNLISGDNAKELSEDYQKNRSVLSAVVHEPASAFVKKLYAERLKEEPKSNLVLFTAGGTGAGKSTGIENIPNLRKLNDIADLVYDTNMNTYDSALKKINQALESGRDVAISYVYRDPIEAFENGMIPRMKRMGRSVPLAEHARTHIGSFDTIKKLKEHFINDQRVSIKIVDNSKGKNNSSEEDFSFLEKRVNFTLDELKKDLIQLTEKLYNENSITREQRKAIIGSSKSNSKTNNGDGDRRSSTIRKATNSGAESSVLQSNDSGELKYRELEQSIEVLNKALDLSLISEEDYDKAFEIYKSRTGVYSDNSLNRKLKRVGQKYGVKGQEDQSEGQEKASDDSKPEKKYSTKELKEFAQNASEEGLQRQIKTSKDPNIRKIAHKELDRRKKEESVEEKKVIKKAEEIINLAFEANKLTTEEYFKSLDYIEKAKKDLSKLTKVKRLVYKNGKTFFQTFHVDLNKEETDEEKVQFHVKSPLEQIKELSQGDNVVWKEGNKSIVGEIAGFSYNEKSAIFWVCIDDLKGTKKYYQLKDSTQITKFNALAAQIQSNGDLQLDENGYKVIKALGGSTGAMLVEKGGIKYVRKGSSKIGGKEHLSSEFKALQLAKQLGMPVPEIQQFTGDHLYTYYFEKSITLKEFLNYGTQIGIETIKAKIKEHFAANALLANWDSIGLSYDNILIDTDGNIQFIDLGGCLGYRAQGGLKPNSMWTDSKYPTELESLLDPNINLTASEMFGGITKEEIKEQLTKLETKIDASSFPKYGNGYVIKDRLKYALGQFKTQEKVIDENSWENFNPIKKESYRKIKELYKNEIKEAEKYGRADVVKLYEDIAKNFSMSEQDEKDAEIAFGKIEFRLSISKEEDVEEYFKKNNIRRYEAYALNQHTDSSTGYNIFKSSVVGMKDGYNISFSDKQEVSFDSKVFNDHNLYSNNARLLAKSLMSAFASMSENEEARDYKRDVTCYRGFDLSPTALENFNKNNVMINTMQASTSVNIKKSFDKNAKIHIAMSEGIDVRQISAYHSEMEVVLKPFNMIQTTAYALDESNSKGRHQIRAEKPGYFPIEIKPK